MLHKIIHHNIVEFKNSQTQHNKILIEHKKIQELQDSTSAFVCKKTLPTQWNDSKFMGF
jgi:hypothetical protein